jgi:hypothetical protein
MFSLNQINLILWKKLNVSDSQVLPPLCFMYIFYIRGENIPSIPMRNLLIDIPSKISFFEYDLLMDVDRMFVLDDDSHFSKVASIYSVG